MKQRGYSAGLVVAACAMLFACEPPPASLSVPLQYTPTNSLSSSVVLPQGQGKICILPVEDQRADKSKIGENDEDPAKPVPVMVDSPSVSDWVHDTIADVFHRNGLNVVANPEDADFLITFSVNTFWVKEASQYDAQIGAIIKVQDKNGKSVYTGVIHGQDNTEGKGLQAQSYRQVLSNSLYNSIDRLLNTDAFQKSLVVGAPAEPAK